ncbi:MAG: hydroxymethylbilane synthase [Ferruginibacter sp.]|nr:hydroxymethylbilane synthase [Ferruginibacter sp.]
MDNIIRIGTRESELAVWQATLVKELLEDAGVKAALVFIKSEGDTDLVTPLYEMGVQGIFTRSLDIALLDQRIDIAVHSMKDVPTQLPAGIVQAAVLKRGNHKDLFVPHPVTKADELFSRSLKEKDLPEIFESAVHTIATSSIRRKAQWLHRYPQHQLDNLRGNVNTRLKKLSDSNWSGAIFAAAGLERIKLRPTNAIELDWMLPAPAQGAIMIVCRATDEPVFNIVSTLNHEETSACTYIEKDFLRALMGGCSTPISALAQYDKKDIYFRGSLLSPDGKQKIEIEKYVAKDAVTSFGARMAQELLENGGKEIAASFKDGK